MNTWNIKIPESSIRSRIQEYCTLYSDTAGKYWIKVCGSTLEEAVKEIIRPLAFALKDNSDHIIAYPDRPRVEEKEYKYANFTERKIFIYLDCKCSTPYTKDSENYREYDATFKTTVEEA